MEQAVNYNRFLIDSLVRWCTGLRRVLDFGAGNGRFALALRERGLTVAAVEPDPVLRAAVAAGGIESFASLGEASGQCIDGVYSINVLEHLPDDAAVLSEMRGRLSPGGRLFLYVPAFPLLFSANDRRVGHRRRYRRAELVARVRAAGFAVERVRYVDALGFPAGLWYRAFGRRDGGLDLRAVRLYDAAVFPLSRLLDRACDRVVGKNLLLTGVCR